MKHNLRASLLAVLFAVVSIAQTSRGTVTGLVTDAGGAAIPAARIELKGVATGIVRTASTNEAGIYRLDAVDPGAWQISITKAGFKAVHSQTFEVGAAQIAAIDAKLAVGTWCGHAEFQCEYGSFRTFPERNADGWRRARDPVSVEADFLIPGLRAFDQIVWRRWLSAGKSGY